MIPNVRDYQADMIERARAQLRQHRSVLVQSPTGSGKTVLSAFMAGSATTKGLKVAFLVHRRELIKQTAATYSEVGIPYGIVSSGITGDRHKPVQICGIQTLVKRLDYFNHFDLIIVDEAHHATASMYATVLDAYPKAKVVGLSATPERLDGAGLSKYFQSMVDGPKVSWLIESGYLSKFRLYAPSQPDLTGVHMLGGDYNRKELESAVVRPGLVGDAVTHYSKLAQGKRAMVFCVSIKHSLSVVERFQAGGYRAAHIDGTMDQFVRDALIADFVSGRIQVLSSVDLVSEGFDLPAMEVAILLRPTKSLSLYLQQVGRALRISPGKDEAIILDHAGNAMTHGLPDDDRTWSLDGRKKRKRVKDDDEPAVPVKQCPDCYHVHRPAPECPRCGHEYPTLGRTVEELEGELQEVERARVKQEQRQEQSKARSLEDLVKLGIARKYKNPHFWAKRVHESRKGS
jgi:superfamily II DNA or RNA helicase